MVVDVNVYESDYTTPVEDYADILAGKTDETLVIRNLTFGHTSAGGFLPFSFDIWQSSAVATAEGDIVEIVVDSTIRYFGKVESVSPNFSDTSQVYETITRVSGRPMLALADRFNYSLREADGGTVVTTVQDLYNDLFLGSGYADKGQDNNQPIVAALTHISYTVGNNTLGSTAINMAYTGTPYAEVAKDCVRIHNSTLDLTAVEPFLWWQKTDKAMYTQQRVTTLLNTFDMDDGDFPTRTAVDLADDGYRIESETSGIYNKFILNGTVITSTQYATEVAASVSAHGTRTAPPLDNKNITVAESSAWLDGFVLGTLEPRNTYHLRLRKSKFGYAPVWFNGGGDTPNGYIKLTEGGAGETFNEPFREAVYTLDTSGWDIRITAGGIRPNVAARSRMLTEFTGLGSYDATLITSITEPSNTADVTRINVPEVFDTGEFQVFYKNPQFTTTAADVEFKIYIAGGKYWTGGTIVKTLDSSSNPPVYEDPDVPGLWKCTWYNASGVANKVVGDPGTTIHSIALTNDLYYKVHAEVTIDNGGVDEVLQGADLAFILRSKTVGDKADDSYGRMPTAEKKNIVTYDPGAGAVDAEVRFYTDVGGDTPPDAGAAGWFITDDSVSWTRMTGDFDGTFTGTTAGTFTVDSDDSEASFIYYNFGTGGAGLRFNIATPEVEVNHDDGAGWVSLATGATNSISASFGGDVYELKVNTADGSLSFTQDPSGTPAVLLKISDQGEITTYDALTPDVDEQDDIGSASKKYNSIFLTTKIYVPDIDGSSDGGATTDWKIEWDGAEGEAFPENIAFGFMD